MSNAKWFISFVVVCSSIVVTFACVGVRAGIDGAYTLNLEFKRSRGPINDGHAHILDPLPKDLDLVLLNETLVRQNEVLERDLISRFLRVERRIGIKWNCTLCGQLQLLLTVSPIRNTHRRAYTRSRSNGRAQEQKQKLSFTRTVSHSPGVLRKSRCW